MIHRPSAPPLRRAAAGRALAGAALLVLAGCATAGGPGAAGGVTGAPVDSATVAAWRCDETATTRVADAGPLRLDGRAGVDTRADFGRVRNGRLFTKSVDSFVYVGYRAPLDPYRGFTIEAWVYPSAWGEYEVAPLVGRWTQQPGEQSWLLALSGLNISPSFAPQPGPSYLSRLVQRGGPGFVVFTFLPDEAGSQRVFATSTALPLERWTHVAVTYDGQLVRFYLNGRQDSQYASAGRIRASRAPLLMGNYFDWRSLSEFGGDLRAELSDPFPYYAFVGTLDEVRLSNEARADFPYARP